MKRFKLTHRDLSWEMLVEIDLPKAMPAIREMVEWWRSFDEKHEINDEDYLEMFLKSLVRECLYIAVGERFNKKGIINAFAGREGWARMDGSKGITIIEVALYEFGDGEFDIEEVKP